MSCNKETLKEESLNKTRHAIIVTLMAKIVMHHATIVAFDDKCMTMGVGG